MYKIYTSYFSNRAIKRFFEPASDRPFLIPVCRFLENFSSDRYYTWYKDLAPSPEILEAYNKVRVKASAIKNRFTDKYTKQLDTLLEQNKLFPYVEQMLELIKYNDVILLCYEPKSKFCHRRILADYLKENFNLDIEEY